jgi:hypothetical protein
VVSEGLKPSDELFGGASGIEAVEVVMSQVVIGRTGAKHVESDGENFVGSSDDGLGHPRLDLTRRKNAGMYPALQWDAAHAA